MLGHGPVRVHHDPRPNVVVIVLDTVRADVLSCYGNPRQTTPRIDALARRGVLFENTDASAPIPLPSHTSILTGVFLREGASELGVGAQTFAQIKSVALL